MLNLLSVLKFIESGVINRDARFTILDDRHVMDEKTGVEIHMYDDDFKLTYNGEIVAKPKHFTMEEQEVVWAIKEFITDPDKMAQRKEEYPRMIKEEREKLSMYFENPNPPNPKVAVAEEDSTEYAG